MIFFDLETTGLDILTDRIIELYALKFDEEKRSELHIIVNPGIPIPIEASNINGFTDELVEDKLPISEHIKEIHDFFEGQDLIGYNILNYDLLILSEEFIRCGYVFNLSSRNVIDLYLLWLKFEPKNLKGALKRFCNAEVEDLHSAKNDVHATEKIYQEMINTFGLKGLNLNELALHTNPPGDSLCFGKLIKNEIGDLILNFGKYSGSTIREIYQKDIEYLRWIYKEHKDYLLKYYVTKEAMKIRDENKK